MITFLRHGETAWNREGRIQGTLDIPLSAAGRQSVERLAAERPSVAVQLIWTSPLTRARETAVILAAGWGTSSAPLPVCELADLAERNYGIYQGQRLVELPRTLRATEEQLLRGEGVEPWHHLQRRVLTALGTIAAGPDEAVVVVHGGWLKALHALLHTGLAQADADNLAGYALERAKLRSFLAEIDEWEVRHEQSAHHRG
jgi:broad specificity phosphatase PhoE